MGMYDYGQRGTYINGFINFIENKCPKTHKTLKIWNDLNNHLKAIRLQQEPKKPVSNNVNKNSFYVQENYDWNIVKEYFKQIESNL